MRTSAGLRVRCSLLAVLTAGLAACSPGSDPASGGGADPGGPSAGSSLQRGTYLALGDSVPFGYISGNPGGYADEDDFVGYPELVAEDEDLRVVNATCPGETTASLLDVDARSNGCTNVRGREPGFRDAYPLHEEYESSQLDHAVQVLRDDDGVELVTLQIGANDAFICLADRACGSTAGIAALAEQVRGNVDTALATLRDEGGYDGRIVVVGYYALDYTDPRTTFGIHRVNDALATAARAHGADVASGFEAFRPVAEAAGGSAVDAGLVYPGDVHPTAEGQRLLADAVEQVLG